MNAEEIARLKDENSRSWLTRYECEALIAEVERQAAELAAAREALIWCSGSPDFAPGGQARIGWETLCQPVLAKFIAEPPK